MHNKIFRLSIILLFTLIGVFIVDQNIKSLFVDGFRYYTDYIDLILVYNKGVAFSMFSSLAENLKYIQLVMVSGVIIYTLYIQKVCYAFPVGLLLGGAFSNIYDRFNHEGVVDMVYWHYGFDFAVFNFADVMIDLAVLWIVILNYKPHFCKN